MYLQKTFKTLIAFHTKFKEKHLFKFYLSECRICFICTENFCLLLHCFLISLEEALKNVINSYLELKFVELGIVSEYVSPDI
jgi:hypothetical protein